MAVTARVAGASLARVLEALPCGHRTLPLDEAHVVVGPTGVFALTHGLPDLDQAARRVSAAARALRELLAQRLSWAPFVDALVVVDGAAGRAEVAAVVPSRLLADVLTSGRPVLTGVEVDRIVTALA